MNIDDVKKKLSTMGLLFDFEQLVFEEFDGDVFFTYPLVNQEFYSYVESDKAYSDFFGLSESSYVKLIRCFSLGFVDNPFKNELVVRNKYAGWHQGSYLLDRNEGRVLRKVEECLLHVELDNWFIKLGRSMDNDFDSFMCLDGKRRPLPESLHGVLKFEEPIVEASRLYSENKVTFGELVFFVSAFNYIGGFPYMSCKLNHWKVMTGSDEPDFYAPRQLSSLDFAFDLDYITEAESKILEDRQDEFERINNCFVKERPYGFV